MILYFCTDVTLKSSGIRLLYKHVHILHKNGIPAAMLHERPGFRMPDALDVPLRYAATPDAITPGDILVIPEVFTTIMNAAKTLPVRRFVIALNWHHLFSLLPDKTDWRSFNIEGCLTNSPHIADLVQWSMRLPTRVFQWAINTALYYQNPAEKILQIVYLRRKQVQMAELQRLLWSRDRRYVENIRWLGLDGLSEPDYARMIRQSQLFLNLSSAEGLPASLFEAMAAGTLVGGWNSVGGQRQLIASGPEQNGIFVENLDYPALAQKLEPILLALLHGDPAPAPEIRANALATAGRYTQAGEESSVLAMWKEILAAPGPASTASIA